MSILTDEQKQHLQQEIKEHVEKYRANHFWDNFPAGPIRQWVFDAFAEFAAEKLQLAGALKDQVESLTNENEELRNRLKTAKNKSEKV